MRSICIRACLFVLVSILPLSWAWADFDSDDDLCASGTHAYDAKLAACTRQIDSGRFSGKYLAYKYVNRANANISKENFDAAISDCNHSLANYPGFAGAYRARGDAFINRGDTDLAIADYKTVLGLKPLMSERLAAYNGLGQACINKQDFGSAITYFNKANHLRPKDLIYIYNRGVALSLAGDYEGAINDFTSVIVREGRDAKAYAQRGEAWRLKGDLEQALQDQDKAVELDPTSPLVFLQRGDTYRYRGDIERAVADYNKAISLLAPREYTPAFTALGLTYEKMGDVAKARAEYQKALNSTWSVKTDVAMTSVATARAHLSALASGAAPPSIPNAPEKVNSETSIPTPNVNVPAVVPAPNASAGRRVALVIGNSAYQNVAALHNPRHDAEKVAETLRALGFDSVTLVTDATRESLLDALRAFSAVAGKSDWAMVYYSGHGIEMDGVNYLIPIDANIQFDSDVQGQAVSVDQVMTAEDGAKRLKLTLLDACRSNPFAPTKDIVRVGASVTRSVSILKVGERLGKGLGAPTELRGDTPSLVVYAAKQGHTALDGEGENSPFAVALIQRLATPGVEITKVFRLVRDDVMEATAGRQEPYTYGSLPGSEDYFFVQRQ